jgi:hypothetical protein
MCLAYRAGMPAALSGECTVAQIIGWHDQKIAD